MRLGGNSAAVDPPVTRVVELSPMRKIGAYARLSNLSVYFHWIPALVGWSLLVAPFDLSTRALLSLALLVMAIVAMASSGGTLDDVQGIRDGIDQKTYASDDTLRKLKGKPIVRGEISLESAFRFAIVIGAIGLVLGLAAVALSPYGSIPLGLTWILFGLAATQYSYGLKLSYHGFAEALLGIEAAAAAIVPLFLVEGGASLAAWLQCYLVGAWFAQVTVFSSSNDAAIDREANRMTLAARLSPAGNRAYILVVFALTWAAWAAGILSGVFDWPVVLALVPSMAIGLFQLYVGIVRQQWLRARYWGWRAFEIGVVLLVAANLLG